MYTEFYGLAKKPFNMTPDPAFLYLTKQHREALAGLTYAILDRKGFLVLSGMAGSGKTTLLAWVLQKLPRTKIESSVILNPTLTRPEFLELAMLGFGLSNIPASKAQRLWTLQKFLLKARQEGKVSVLIVDEAHKLDADLLEEVRLLGNFEHADEKLLQILLIGQSELDDVLNRPDLWQLKQRVSVRLLIAPLSANEVEHYIRHRWRVAGGQNPPPFSPGAMVQVVRWSQCIPRLINSICDNALILAFAEEASSVSADHINSAALNLGLIEQQLTKGPAVTAISGSPVTVQPAPAPTIPDGAHATATPGAFAPVQPIKTNRRQPATPLKQSVLGRWVDKLGLSNHTKKQL